MKLTRSQVLILLLAAFISLGIYLLISGIYHQVGFPLDDAWIHQVFARNLIQTGKWTFNAGKVTAGSTSPLWTVLLSLGVVIKLAPFYWTFFLGGMMLFITGLLSEAIARNLLPGYMTRFPWLGLLIILEWHLAWAAGSGMETLALAAMYLLIMWLLVQRKPKWYLLGSIIGLSVWLRPEGLTWIVPALIFLFMKNKGLKAIVISLLGLLGTFLIFGFVYCLFNYSLSGTWFPNTFYAKQVEYSVLVQQSIWVRSMSMYLLPINGVGFLLLPGLVYYLIRICRVKQYYLLSIPAWFVGYVLMYAILLPVTYQHGRYLIPAMPVFFVMGFMGYWMVVKAQHERFLVRILSNVWRLSLLLTTLFFYILGGFAYATDVAIIETEMVAVAKWLDLETPRIAVVAAHDIGAIGYYGNRTIIDLAGLINPEVIPMIRDETQLAAYLSDNHVDYLVTFPDWYPELIYGKTQIYSTDSMFSRAAGHTNMAVYIWK
jgi:hypothetical protein